MLLVLLVLLVFVVVALMLVALWVEEGGQHATVPSTSCRRKGKYS